MVTSIPSGTTLKLTLEQFLHHESTKPASEFWDGEVLQKAMPTGEHGTVQRLLSVVFTVFIRDHPIADGGPEIRCNFRSAAAAYSPVPDFIIVRSEKLPRGRLRGHVEGPPDIAVEILSPDDLMSRVMRKIRFYLANGVAIVWLVNPYDRTVTVWSALEPNVARTFGETATLYAGDTLPGFAVVVRDILPPSDPDDEGGDDVPAVVL